jgi:hypothetical protein
VTLFSTEILRSNNIIEGGLGITEGDVTIDATFKAKDNIIGASIKWISDKLGATIFVDGDSADNLKNVEFETSRNIQGKDVNLFGGYNFLSKKASGKLSFQVDDSLVSMSYDNKNEDPKVRASFSSDNVISLAYSLDILLTKIE